MMIFFLLSPLLTLTNFFGYYSSLSGVIVVVVLLVVFISLFLKGLVKRWLWIALVIWTAS